LERSIGAVFNKRAETRALAEKVEETFKIMSKGGKSSTTGAKGFPELEAAFDEFFEVAMKPRKQSSSVFVGMRLASQMKMAKIKGVQTTLLWLRQKLPMGHSTGESEQKIKQALAEAMEDKDEMETSGQAKAGTSAPSFELVPAAAMRAGPTPKTGARKRQLLVAPRPKR
jgi:hypothetical protein